MIGFLFRGALFLGKSVRDCRCFEMVQSLNEVACIDYEKLFLVGQAVGSKDSFFR